MTSSRQLTALLSRSKANAGEFVCVCVCKGESIRLRILSDINRLNACEVRYVNEKIGKGNPGVCT